MRFLFLASSLVALLAGCSDPEEVPPTTADYSASEISLYTLLQTNGGVAQVSVSAMAEGRLLGRGGDDSFSFREKGGPAHTLTFVSGTFVGQLETNATSFELVFSRGAATITTSLEAPPPFSLAGPEKQSSRTAPIPLTWGPPGTGFETWLDIAGPCLSIPISRYFSADVEAYEIQPADLAIQPGTVDCDLRVWVTRSATAGAIASAFAPSAAPGAVSVRSISIPTLP